MDPIREAVAKARAAETKSPERRPFQRPSRFGREQAPDDGAFLEAKCDFSRFAANRIISNEQDPVLSAYRVLRTRALQKMEAEGWKTVAITSPNAGAGKTVTAINLAIAVGSKKGSRAMLVDLDFYRPNVAKYLGISEPPSVLDYYEGKKTLRETTLRPDLPDMLVVANERVTRRGAEFLGSPKTDELIERGLNEFGARIVIFDVAPLLGCDDAIALLPKVDCALLVAASGGTRAEDFREARRLLGKTNILGAVLNKAPRGLAGRSYYY